MQRVYFPVRVKNFNSLPELLFPYPTFHRGPEAVAEVMMSTAVSQLVFAVLQRLVDDFGNLHWMSSYLEKLKNTAIWKINENQAF